MANKIITARDIRDIVSKQQDRPLWKKEDVAAAGVSDKEDPEPDMADREAWIQWKLRQDSKLRRGTIDVSEKKPTA